jgi:hypothetical protein
VGGCKPDMQHVMTMIFINNSRTCSMAQGSVACPGVVARFLPVRSVLARHVCCQNLYNSISTMRVCNRPDQTDPGRQAIASCTPLMHC